MSDVQAIVDLMPFAAGLGIELDAATPEEVHAVTRPR